MASPTYSAEYLAESRTTLLKVFYSIPIPLEFLTTAMRLWSKTRTEQGLASDDYLMVWATAVSIGVCISGLVYGAPYGFGRHIEAISKQDLQTFLMGDYIFSHFYDVAIASTKLSVLSLYYRIFPARIFQAVVIATAVFVLLWLVTMEVVLGLECRPIQAWWGATTGSCLNLVAFAYFTNITNLVTDMWIFLMPMPIILRLQTTTNKKILLCFLFSVGLGTCAISGARLTFVFSEGSTDITWTEVPLGILSAWEPCGGILCANLPVIHKSIVQGFKHLKGSVATWRSQSQVTKASQDPSEESTSREWIRLGNGSGGQVYVSGNKWAPKATEMEILGSQGIVLERDLVVTSTIENTPVRPPWVVEKDSWVKADER